MSKPFLILQIRPEDKVADDEYQAFLRAGELSSEDTVRIQLDRQSIPGDIDVRDYSGIVLGGGPACLSDTPDKKPSYQKRFERELFELMRHIGAHDTPFIGACYGIGLLAAYLGAAVNKSAYNEAVGAVMVNVTKAGKRDQLLTNIPESFQAFTGHKETVQAMPSDATLLIDGKKCPYQMIRYQQNIYGLQFHPELDPAGLELRIHAYRDLGYFKPEEADQLIDDGYAATVIYPQRIFKNFVKQYSS